MTKLPATKYVPVIKADHGPRFDTRRVIIHTAQGTALGSISWWQNPDAGGTGAQVIIGLDKAYQTMDLNHKAWQCINANSDGIGIEHEAWAEWSKRTWMSRKNRRMLRMSANRCAWICYHYHLGHPQHGRNVFGHREVPGNDHVDPGKGFPWTFYMTLARRAYKNLVKTHGKEWDK